MIRVFKLPYFQSCQFFQEVNMFDSDCCNLGYLPGISSPRQLLDNISSPQQLLTRQHHDNYSPTFPRHDKCSPDNTTATTHRHFLATTNAHPTTPRQLLTDISSPRQMLTRQHHGNYSPTFPRHDKCSPDNTTATTHRHFLAKKPQPMLSIYSILPITRTSKGPMKMVRVNECSTYRG